MSPARPPLAVVLAAMLALSAGRPSTALASWATDGNLVVGSASAPVSPVVVTCASAGVYLAWVDARSGYNSDIRVTLWTAAGLPASGWTRDGNLATEITCTKHDLCAVPDGSGGALFAWGDNRCVGYQQIYATRVTAAGASAAGWVSNGVRLAATSNNQLTPAIAADGAGGAFVAWQDVRGTDADIYLQHVNGAGAVVDGWPANGLAIVVVAGVQSAPAVVSDDAGGVFVSWQDRRAGNDDVYVQHVSADGALIPGWPTNGVAACAAAGDQRIPRMISDDAGGVVLAWQDQRGGGWDVYASRMHGSGALASGWSADGTAVCVAGGDQTAVRAARDGAQGAFLVWQDGRGSDLDVYAIRLDANGTVPAGWLANGSAIGEAPADQTAPDVAADDAGGIYVTWQDRQLADADIRALHVVADGSTAAGWSEDGSLLCGAAGDQIAPRIAVSLGDAYALWADARGGGSMELYAQRSLSGGPIPVRPSGITAVHHDGQTFLSWVAPPDTGWTHRVYYRSTPIATDADLTSATLLGSVGDSAATDRRLSSLLGTTYTFRVDSAAAALAADRGLFVVTVPANRAGCYAVTSQLFGGPEDRHVVPGGNSLLDAVPEFLAPPRPVYQERITRNGTTSDVYTLWTWPQDTPYFPAMSNRASWPYDCGVTHGISGGPAFVRPHHRGGSFTDVLQSPSSPSEWVLALDDYSLNSDVQTYWYGYHTGYDFTSDTNQPPATGYVKDYTNRRCLYTIRWWRRTFAFDTTSTYAFGYSLGGTYSMHLGLVNPELVAATMSSAGKVDFSFESDPESLSAFNPGRPYRLSLSNLWGTTATNLACSEELPIYSEMNDDSLAARAAATGAAFLVNFAGRHDLTVGWAEKRGFYAAMESHRQGGIQFWDDRDHTGLLYPGALSPMSDPRYLYRFKSNLSWPAFSRCSANGDPGEFTATSGDSVGTLNGYMDWDPALVDSSSVWQILLRTRGLTTQWGPLPAPESLTVDVTPRRVQHFMRAAGMLVTWTATRVSDGALVQSGSVNVDPLGLITIPAVKTYRAGTRLRLGDNPSLLATPPGMTRPAVLSLAPFRNPVRDRVSLVVSWPRDGRARVAMFDLGGRVARTLWDAEASAGDRRVPGDLTGLAPGVYLLRAEQAGASVTRRLVLLR